LIEENILPYKIFKRALLPSFTLYRITVVELVGYVLSEACLSSNRWLYTPKAACAR